MKDPLDHRVPRSIDAWFEERIGLMHDSDAHFPHHATDTGRDHLG